jgi:hypothetical protein
MKNLLEIGQRLTKKELKKISGSGSGCIEYKVVVINGIPIRGCCIERGDPNYPAPIAPYPGEECV